MNRIVYYAPSNDGKALAATNHLMHGGCRTGTVVNGSEAVLAPDDDGIVLLFTSAGRFPSHHLRLLKEGDAERRGFVIPDIPIRNPGGKPVHFVALQDNGVDPRSDRTFHTAIDDLHYRLSGAARPKKPKKSSGWKSGYHAKKRVRHASPYAL